MTGSAPLRRSAQLPGAAELFRSTASNQPDEPVRPARAVRRVRPVGTPSGRERHDEKITVYLSPDELVALETTRLALRAEHAERADRGRIVREALAVVLADFEAKGADSILVRRLNER